MLARRMSSLSLSLFLYSINFPKYRKYTLISCEQRGYLSQPRKETLFGCSSNKKNIRNRHTKRSKAYCGYVNHWIWIILKLYEPLMKSSIMCQWQKPWNIFKCTNPFLFKMVCCLHIKDKSTFFSLFLYCQVYIPFGKDEENTSSNQAMQIFSFQASNEDF